MKILSKIYTGLNAWQKIEMTLLWLALIMMPIDWNVSVCAMAVLMLIGVIRAVATHEKQSSKSRLYNLIQWALIAYVVWYAVSLLWTDNIQYGLKEVGQKLTLIFMAVYMLVVDADYLTHERKTVIMYSYSIVLSAISIFCWCRVGYRVCFDGVEYGSRALFLHHFYNVHHTYLSMFVLLAVAFVTHEMVCRRHLVANAVMTVLMGLLLVGVDSQLGLIAFGVVGAMMTLCGLMKRNFLPSIAVALLTVLILGSTQWILPKNLHRVSQSVEGMAASGQIKDDGEDKGRTFRWQTSLQTIERNGWLLGTGAGDFMDQLQQSHLQRGDTKAVSRHFNSHNMLLDTTLTVGIVGLLLLLFVIVGSLALAWKNRDMVAMVTLVVIALAMLCESVLERQMGCAFMGWVTGVLLYRPVSFHPGQK